MTTRILAAVALLATVALVVSILTRPEIPEPTVVTRTVTEHTRDTLYVRTPPVRLPGRIDTVEVIRVDTVNVIDATVRSYTTVFGDSTINGKVESTVQGFLEDQDITYDVTRETIIDTVTNTTTVEKTFVVKKSFLQLGAMYQFDTQHLNPVVLFTHKSGIGVMYSYDIAQKGHSAGIYIPIRIR